MKHNIYNKILTVLTIATVMSTIFTSCQKIDPLNPEAEDLPEASFTLSAIETRGTEVEFPWTISKDGKTDSVNEEIDDMYVTKYNELVININNEMSNFQGVNVTSSNTNAVVVEEFTPKSYRLKYKHDGEADITVWNGSRKKSSTTITFHVKSKKEIAPKAVLFIYDEGTPNEKILKANLWVTNEKHLMELSENHYYKPEQRRLEEDDYPMVIIRKKGTPEEVFIEEGKIIHSMKYFKTEPENISFRNVSFTTKTWNYQESAEHTWYNWLNENNYQYDWSEYQGEIKDMHKNIYHAMNENCSMGFRLGWCEIRFMHEGIFKYGTALMTNLYLNN